MKSVLKNALLITFFALFTFTSCENELIDVNAPNDQDVILPNSTLANLMRNTSAHDGSVDDILDHANCLAINLPVTIVVNDITITINTLEDLALIEAIFNEFEDDNDILEFLFPITIILNDYTEVTINNEDELESFIERCNEIDDVIECVDFQYPISFSLYNADFQITDTIVLESNEQLYRFLNSLEDNDNGVVLASLNFPVTLVYANGETLEVNNNQELEAAIRAAEENCDDDTDQCSDDDVASFLQECIWFAGSNLYDNVIGDEFDFGANGQVTVTNPVGGDPVEGGYSVRLTDLGVIVTLDIPGFFEIISREWKVIECNERRIKMINGDDYLVFERDCETNGNPIECFSDTELVKCDDDTIDGITTFNLELVYPNCPNDNVEIAYYKTTADAENQVNQLSSNYTNISNPQTIYARVRRAGTDNFAIFEVALVVENCNPQCSEADVDAFLLECQWNVVNYNGSNDLIVYALDFQNENMITITEPGTDNQYSGYWATSVLDDGSVKVEFANINGPNIQAISGFWIVVECEEARLELHSNDNLMVLERICD